MLERASCLKCLVLAVGVCLDDNSLPDIRTSIDTRKNNQTELQSKNYVPSNFPLLLTLSRNPVISW